MKDVGIHSLLVTKFQDIVAKLSKLSHIPSIEMTFIGHFYDFHNSVLSVLDKYRCFTETDVMVDSQLLNATFREDSHSEDWAYLKEWVIGTWDLLLPNIKNVRRYLQRVEVIARVVSCWSVSMSALSQRIIYEELSKADDANISESHFIESVCFSQLPQCASDVLSSASNHFLSLLKYFEYYQEFSDLIESTFVAFWRMMGTLKGYAFVADNLSAFIIKQSKESNCQVISDLLKLLTEDSRNLNLLDVCFVVALQLLDSLEGSDNECHREVCTLARLFARSLHGVMDCQLLPSILHWLPALIQSFLTIPTKHSAASNLSDSVFKIHVIKAIPLPASAPLVYLSKIHAIILADLAEMEVHDRASQFSQHSTQTMDAMVAGIRALALLPMQCAVYHSHWLDNFLGNDKHIAAWSKLFNIWLSMDSEASIMDSLSSLLSKDYNVGSSNYNNRHFHLNLRVVEMMIGSCSKSRRIETRMSFIACIVLVKTLLNLTLISDENLPMVIENERGPGPDNIIEAIRVSSKLVAALKKCKFSVKNHECLDDSDSHVTGMLFSYQLFFVFFQKLSSIKHAVIDLEALGRWTYALLVVMSQNFNDLTNSNKSFTASLLSSFCSKLTENIQTQNSACVGYIVQFWHQHLQGHALPPALVQKKVMSLDRSAEPSPKRLKPSVVVVETCLNINHCEVRSVSRVKSLFKEEAETQSQSHPIPFDPPCNDRDHHSNDVPNTHSPNDSISRRVSFKESPVKVVEKSEERSAELSNHGPNRVDAIIEGLHRTKSLLQSSDKGELERGLEGLTDALVALACLQRDTLKEQRGCLKDGY